MIVGPTNFMPRCLSSLEICSASGEVAWCVRARATDDRLVVDLRPEPFGEAAVLFLDREEGARVERDGFQFAAMADHAGIRHQSVDLLGVEARDLTRIEVRERLSIVITLLQDGDPGQAGLRAFEDELFEEQPVIVHGYAPFIVVISDVERIFSAPEAAWLRLGHGQALVDRPRSQAIQPAGRPRARAPRTIFSW